MTSFPALPVFNDLVRRILRHVPIVQLALDAIRGYTQSPRARSQACAMLMVMHETKAMEFLIYARP